MEISIGKLLKTYPYKLQVLTHIKHILLFLLTFLLGATPTHAKTEAVFFVPSYTQHFTIAQTAQSHTPQKTVPLNTEFTLPDGTTFEGNCNIAEYQGERYVELVQEVDDWFSLSSFKNISAKIPGGVNKTNIGKTLWNDAYKMTPPNGSSAKNIIYNIIANGDALARRRFATA